MPFLSKGDYEYLNETIRVLREKNTELEKQVGLNEIQLINKITKGNFAWFDYHTLDQSQLQMYHADAQMFLNSDVVKNEAATFIRAAEEWALRNAEDFKGVHDMRMSVIAIEAFLKRFQAIPDPINRILPAQDPYASM